jgi:hypothetical protein
MDVLEIGRATRESPRVLERRTWKKLKIMRRLLPVIEIR